MKPLNQVHGIVMSILYVKSFLVVKVSLKVQGKIDLPMNLLNVNMIQHKQLDIVTWFLSRTNATDYE